MKLSPSSLKKIGDSVHSTERDSGTAGTDPAAPPTNPAPWWAWVRVTGAVSGGLYPAVLTYRNPDTSSWVDGEVVKLRPLNSEPLNNTQRYPSVPDGELSGATPIFRRLDTDPNMAATVPFAYINSTFGAGVGEYVAVLVTYDPVTDTFNNSVPGTTVILRAPEALKISVPSVGQFAYYRVEPTGLTVSYSSIIVPLYTLLSAPRAVSYQGVGIISHEAQYMGRGTKTFDSIAIASVTGTQGGPGLYYAGTMYAPGTGAGLIATLGVSPGPISAQDFITVDIYGQVNRRAFGSASGGSVEATAWVSNGTNGQLVLMVMSRGPVNVGLVSAPAGGTPTPELYINGSLKTLSGVTAGGTIASTGAGTFGSVVTTGNGTIGGNLTVTGNLTLNGTMTTTIRGGTF